MKFVRFKDAYALTYMVWVDLSSNKRLRVETWWKRVDIVKLCSARTRTWARPVTVPTMGMGCRLREDLEIVDPSKSLRDAVKNHLISNTGNESRSLGVFPKAGLESHAVTKPFHFCTHQSAVTTLVRVLGNRSHTVR